MGKTIKIELSSKGASDLLKVVEDYQKKVEAQTETFLERIADELIAYLDVAYAGAHGLGYDPITFKKEKLQTGGYRVVAESPEIAFIEFGAGVYATGGGYAESPNITFDVCPGSWSKEHGQTWQREIEQQHQDPMKYRYNVKATNGMYQAVEAVKSELPRIAKEVFTNG